MAATSVAAIRANCNRRATNRAQRILVRLPQHAWGRHFAGCHRSGQNQPDLSRSLYRQLWRTPTRPTTGFILFPHCVDVPRGSYPPEVCLRACNNVAVMKAPGTELQIAASRANGAKSRALVTEDGPAWAALGLDPSDDESASKGCPTFDTHVGIALAVDARGDSPSASREGAMRGYLDDGCLHATGPGGLFPRAVALNYPDPNKNRRH